MKTKTNVKAGEAVSYFSGRLLTAVDFQSEQSYQQGKKRLP